MKFVRKYAMATASRKRKADLVHKDVLKSAIGKKSLMRLFPYDLPLHQAATEKAHG
jgi:hypothetical protein